MRTVDLLALQKSQSFVTDHASNDPLSFCSVGSPALSHSQGLNTESTERQGSLQTILEPAYQRAYIHIYDGEVLKRL